MARLTIDDVADGPQMTESGILVGSVERKAALRLIDYVSDVIFAVGAGAFLGTMYDRQISNESGAIAVGGTIFALSGLSQRVSNSIMRYIHNRGTYNSFLDLIRRV